jgi:hypothetical protein
LLQIIADQEKREMNIHTPRVDSHQLANATIRAVDRIGEAAAEEINEAADELIRGANEIAAKLRDLAEAIKGHSKVAHEQVTVFCDRATSVLDGIRALQGRLEKTECGPEVGNIKHDIRAAPVHAVAQAVAYALGQEGPQPGDDLN